MPRRRPFAAMAALAPLFALLIGGASGCGPSFQAVYEGNSRFEHCYALEENPAAPMPDKASCWRDWSERYTYGQTKDRIHYATARYVALTEAPHAPTDEALMMAAPGETPRATTITAPAPTNAFAPPPKVLEASEQRTPLGSHSASGPNVDAGAPAPMANPNSPAWTCADGCGAENAGCSKTCGGAKGKPCADCLTTYRACIRDCFK